MLAATDGHAKNFSIRLLPEGRFRLTPLYDILSMWPVVGNRASQIHLKKLRLAMAVRGRTKHYAIDEIHRRHFNSTAQQCGIGPDMESIIDETVRVTPSVLEVVAAQLPDRFPQRLFDKVANGLNRSAKQLASMSG